jgi:hypothetical protein
MQISSGLYQNHSSEKANLSILTAQRSITGFLKLGRYKFYGGYNKTTSGTYFPTKVKGYHTNDFE